MIVTSNQDYAQLKAEIGDRVVSRLTEMCEELPLYGPDLRDRYVG